LPFSSGKVKSGALSWIFMVASSTRPTYRTVAKAVICGCLGMAMVMAQVAQRTSVSKGPRAVALLRLQSNGKAQLIPVSIMVDGRFYDANAYKATPVPMALENGTVYEAEQTGNSRGLFTVTKVVQQKNSWIGDGSWLPTGAAPPSTGMKAEAQPREEEDKPPTLRRGSSHSTSPDNTPTRTQSAPPAAGAGSPPSPSDDSDRPRLKSGTENKDQAPSSAPPAQPTAVPSASRQPTTAASSEQEPDDPSRPTLKRGKQAPSSTSTDIPKAESKKTPDAKSASTTKQAQALSPAASASAVQLIPAISDAGGPEPRPYTYEMKAGEEQAFRKKMLALATEEIWKQARLYNPALASSQTAPKPGARGTKIAKTPSLNFEDVNLRVFDVATNNEPILVLTATTTLPRTSPKTENDQPPPTYYIALVTHSDMYGELRTLLSAVTDDRHLDVSPRMNLVDAVDADGDGRAELLFEQIFDTGKAYVIYRVGADQLWALYQGTPTGSS
jgi:hypothetical protein